MGAAGPSIKSAARLRAAAPAPGRRVRRASSRRPLCPSVRRPRLRPRRPARVPCCFELGIDPTVAPLVSIPDYSTLATRLQRVLYPEVHRRRAMSERAFAAATKTIPSRRREREFIAVFASGSGVDDCALASTDARSPGPRRRSTYLTQGVSSRDATHAVPPRASPRERLHRLRHRHLQPRVRRYVRDAAKKYGVRRISDDYRGSRRSSRSAARLSRLADGAPHRQRLRVLRRDSVPLHVRTSPRVSPQMGFEAPRAFVPRHREMGLGA